jgi:regulatory protein
MNVADPKLAEVRFAAMNLLAQREHAAEELRQKLARRFEQSDLVSRAVAQLALDGLQSDERFTEAFVNMRIRQGKGPLRIRLELKAKGIAPSLVDAFLDERCDSWLTLAREVRNKRFGEARVDNPRDKARQIRFLQYRGFTTEQIQRVLL